jgi:hypothetical protein
MIVTCSSCHVEYDDVYRLTYCPHEPFAMRTVAVNGRGETKVCTSLDELQMWIGWDLGGPDRTVVRLPDGKVVELP